MTAQELKEAGERLFKAGQYINAIPLLKAAAEAFPNDESLWQELVLAAHHSGQYEQAVEFAKQAIHQHTRSGWLWRQLGCELTATDRLDEAEKAFNNARSVLSNSDQWLWRYLAALHRKRKNLEKEIEALEYLHALGQANSTDMNQLGIAYHNFHNYAKAVEFYSRSAVLAPDPAPLFNMGLVFNDPEVSQDADAADAYRRALALNPDYERAKDQLEATKRKLIPLAVKARDAACGLVQPGDHFQFYINPFEALQLDVSAPFGDLDIKTVQRAKKRLLQEIELNDGKVGWLDDYTLDNSRALALEDELHSDEKRSYHWAVFQNKRLLGFLTHGDIEHFLYADEYFPKATLELVDEEPGFRSFLSKPFARQYNFVLTRAIERRLLAVVEVLFDGRRWVEPGDEDICFEGIYRWVSTRIEWMEQRAEDCKHTKIGLSDVERFIEENTVVETFNLLPTAFRTEQSRMVAAIRTLAVECYNSHGDSQLAGEILSLCKRFHFKSIELNTQLEKDFEEIEKIVTMEEVLKYVGAAARHKEESRKNALVWVLVVVGIIVVLGIIGSRDSGRTPSGGSSSQPGTVYHVPSYATSELERDRLRIVAEEASAKVMMTQLDNLARQIERERLYVNRTSESAVAEFNRKVDTYNDLLTKFRAQEQLVNEMIERYNKKLQKYGR